MFPELCELDLLESEELPRRTLVAPLDVIREIRLTLGELDIDIRVGQSDAVIVSSDLYAAFRAWSDAETGEGSWLN